jgi:hypothetical protein
VGCRRPAPRDQVTELARCPAACDVLHLLQGRPLLAQAGLVGERHEKEALCRRPRRWRVHRLAGALTGIKQLQADWKAVGPVRRNRAELLWKRFRAACDKFFERYGSRHQIAEQQKLEQRASVVTTIEALAAEVAAGTLPEGIATTVQDLWNQWQNGAGLSGEAGAALRARFDAALHAVVGAAGEAFDGSRFDVGAQVARRTALCEEVETAVAGPSKPSEAGSSPAATLAALLRESLAANTIGGRVNEDSKLRVVADKVRRAQQQWRDLGPAFGDAAVALEGRFHKAVRRFLDRHPSMPRRRMDRGCGPGGPPRHGAGGLLTVRAAIAVVPVDRAGG